MTVSLTDALCTKCGLCCDGSLLADVELTSRAEATKVQILGLRIDEDSDRALMLLPCAGLHGTRCSVYAHRPKCCRTFECKLLQEAQLGVMSVEVATRRIAQARSEIGRVEKLMTAVGVRDRSLPLKESCAELLAHSPSDDPKASQMRLELEAAMAALQRYLKKHFLG